MSETSTSPEVVLAHLDSLPTLPAVAVRVLQATVDENSGAPDVIRLIRNDQSLTAKILSVASSAAMGVREPVTTLDRAVPLIGFSAVRSIVLATSVFECFAQADEEPVSNAFDRLEFWKHSVAVGCAARRLAREAPEKGVEAEEAFVAGLLHDLGKVALDTVFPKAYDRIAAQANQGRGDIADSERQILGTDHTIAGRRLAERWRLPTTLQEVIWLHHLSSEAMPATVANGALIVLVQLADTLAREQHIGYSGNHMFYELSPRLGTQLGFSSEQVARVVEGLAADVAEQAALLGLDGETAQSMYAKAMMRANAELGRLNEELVTGNQRLAAGARYFNAIIEFERQLTDWSDPAAVLNAVAGAAATALQRPRVAAFGLRQNYAAVDVSVAEPHTSERRHHTQAVPLELADWMTQARSEIDTVVLPTPQPVRALLSNALGTELSGGAWLLPVFHNQDLAGGIVYVSESDERGRLAAEASELKSFLASLGLALGRANAQTAARRLSEDLAETNRRLQHMQVELLRSRTLSMIAEMAAGAGHELNGPLTVISGRAQMLSAAVSDPESRRTLQTIIDKAHECSGIVSELMDFARPRPPQFGEVALDELLAEARVEWLQKEQFSASKVRLEAMAKPAGEASSAGGAAPLVIRADAGQIKMVLRELLTNARMSLEDDDGLIVMRCQPAVQADLVEIVVTDTGRGMSPAVLQRAFDPFYSHHNAGRGRGLGLARAYRVIEAHGGRIWLESRPEEGTAAHVLLPRVPPHVSGVMAQ